MQKNKELPALPVHPVQDQFGQVILMTGFTKGEAVALEVLKALLMSNPNQDNPEELNYLIKHSFYISDKFCSYLENKIEP